MIVLPQPQVNTNIIHQQNLQKMFSMQSPQQPKLVFVQAPLNPQKPIVLPTVPQPDNPEVPQQKTKYIITHVVTPPKPPEKPYQFRKSTKRNVDEIYIDNRPELGLKKTSEITKTINSLEPNPPIFEDYNWERKKLRENMEQFKHLIDVRKIGSHTKDEKEKEMIKLRRNKRLKKNHNSKRHKETTLNAIKFYHDSCLATKTKYKSSMQTMIKEFMEEKIAPIGLCISHVVMLPLRLRKNEIKIEVCIESG
jgi:hypothetical protein